MNFNSTSVGLQCKKFNQIDCLHVQGLHHLSRNCAVSFINWY